jgi:hypothetical protein
MVSRKVNDGSKGPKSLTYAISLKGKTVEIISNRDDKKYKIEYVVDGEEHIFDVLPMDDILAKAHWDAGALVVEMRYRGWVTVGRSLRRYSVSANGKFLTYTSSDTGYVYVFQRCTDC